jgi:hypothetical protein
MKRYVMCYGPFRESINAVLPHVLTQRDMAIIRLIENFVGLSQKIDFVELKEDELDVEMEDN